MRGPCSSRFSSIPLSGALFRALGLAFALALLSVAFSFALGQEHKPSPSPVGDSWQPIRIISDPATASLWLLQRDVVHPGGPGRMERIHSGGRTLAMAGVSAILAAVAPPIIRAGDHLTAEEETPVVSVHLKAMALGPARPHDHFKVRLDLGGKTVEAIALAAGQAVLVTSTTARSGIAETKQ